MCLAIPGKVTEIHEGAGGLPFGTVRFGAVARDVCLAYTPDVAVGDFVIVHVGVAIQKLDEAEANRALDLLDEAYDSADRAGEEPVP